MSELPRGWINLYLQDISQRITKGSTPTSYGFEYQDSGIKFIKTENIDQNGNIDSRTAHIDEATNLFLKRSILKENDILFSIAGTIGRVGIVKRSNLPANTNQALAIIRLYNNISYQRYIYYLLKSPIIQNQAKGSKVGVGRANVSLTDINNFHVPLPPLPEQHRIVAKIEELFTKLDAGVETLQKTKTLLKQYRQSVLMAAVEGKLTEEWRKEHKSLPAPRPGKFYVYVIKCSNGSNYIDQTNDLPKRYREHKEGRGADWTRKYSPQYVMYWEELDSRVTAVEREKWLKTGFGRKWIKRSEKAGRTWHTGEIEPASVLLERIQAERKQRLGSKYKSPKPIDTSNLPELPDGWVWASVDDTGANENNAIVDGPFGSNLKVVDYDPNGQIPVVSITNINKGYDDRNLRYINHTKFNEIKRSSIKPGDILMAKIGSSYGKCGYYPDNMPIGIIPANMLKVTVDCNINKSYLYNYFKSLSFKRRLDKIMKSTAQPAFNVTTFKTIAVPLPPKKEQDIIVTELARLISIIDESKQIIDAELKRSQSLRQSILKRAFEGKLVPQDPADPPASELLERIKKQ